MALDASFKTASRFAATNPDRELRAAAPAPLATK
jgi:hypothetical protein